MKNIAFDFGGERNYSGEKRGERDLAKNAAKIGKELVLPIETQSRKNARQFVELFDSADQHHRIDIDDAALANCEPNNQDISLAKEFRHENENVRLQPHIFVF